ncbi:hypothetical protein KIN20_018812 [Parelaphostrongylus tenuis]|uniref:Uncharacterized protein n=1 Tax=Parelaphostrongylus tenuis TaxID=148309 RepID=A0AAD5N4Q1_PARTN|nr:hypothetical protein KIN20_018812 [Parelaphostrongylus tenuis]
MKSDGQTTMSGHWVRNGTLYGVVLHASSVKALYGDEDEEDIMPKYFGVGDVPDIIDDLRKEFKDVWQLFVDEPLI